MRQPKLNRIKTTGTTTGDVHFPKVKLLLPFDGSNGATSTTDSSNTGNTITFNGNAQISTTQSKFGSSSAYFDGTGDYIDLGGSSLRSVCDSGDFALELWFYQDSRSSWASLITNYGTNNGGWAVYINNASPNQVYWWHYNGSGWVYLNYSQGTRTTITLDTWHHLAVTRSGNTWRLFLNGVQEDTITDSNSISASDGAVVSGLRLGTINAGHDYPLHGYIDDVRITNGDARYTSNFTPPTTAHLTSAGDVNKHIVVNSDADGVAIGTGGINQARVAKAWVRFDQTGSQSIDSSYNISSITDTNTGISALNFSAAMADAEYSVVATGGSTNARYYASTWAIGTSSFQVRNFSVYNGSSLGEYYIDRADCSAIVFGN